MSIALSDHTTAKRIYLDELLRDVPDIFKKAQGKYDFPPYAPEEFVEDALEQMALYRRAKLVEVAYGVSHAEDKETRFDELLAKLDKASSEGSPNDSYYLNIMDTVRGLESAKKVVLGLSRILEYRMSQARQAVIDAGFIQYEVLTDFEAFNLLVNYEKDLSGDGFIPPGMSFLVM